MSDSYENLGQILEAALFSAGEPLSAERLQQMFAQTDQPSVKDIKASLEVITENCEERGVELVEVASGYRFQAKPESAEYLRRLWQRKPPKYSRAFLETLALIVYRQPITRGEVEDVRGVAVSTNIMKNLQDHNWVKVVGTRDVPGKPALFGTTKLFLDDFNLKTLSDLPPLQEIMNVEALEEKLGLKFDLAENAEDTADTDEEDENLENEDLEEAALSESETSEEADVLSESEDLEEADELSESEDLEETDVLSESEDLEEADAFSESEDLEEADAFSESEDLEETDALSETEDLEETDALSESEAPEEAALLKAEDQEDTSLSVNEDTEDSASLETEDLENTLPLESE